MLFQKYRELRGLSRAQAAAELKTSRVTVYRWELGQIAPSPSTIRKVREWSQGAVTGDDMLAPHQQRAMTIQPMATNITEGT